MQEEIACREMKVKCVGGGWDHDAAGALMSTAPGFPALDGDFVVILWKWQRSDWWNKCQRSLVKEQTTKQRAAMCH